MQLFKRTMCVLKSPILGKRNAHGGIIQNRFVFEQGLVLGLGIANRR